MHKFKIHIAPTLLFLLGALILAACGEAAPATPSPTPETPSSAAGFTETPESGEERTLVICRRSNGEESLYPYQPESFGELEVIYDGPIDNQNFDYQPVILKKLPSLADGDARLLPVDVAAGDRVVDVNGAPVELEAGVRVRPSGCQSHDCAIEYDGSFNLQMDQLVARFELLTGLLWSDGEPLTASDSVYSYHLQSHPDTPGGEWDFSIDIERTASYQALDELTTEWKGLPGYLDSTYKTNFFTPAPEHAWGHLTPKELLTAEVSNERPLGWGPYVIEEWDPDTGLTLTKNENYFRREEGLPHFDRLVYHFVEENLNANLARLQSGECDLLRANTLGTFSASDYEQLAELSNQGQLKAEFRSGGVFQHLGFGIQPASYDDGWQPGDRPDFFSDVRVRRAFALCIDRGGLYEGVGLSDPSIAPDTYLPPLHPLYNPDTVHYAYDPAAGAALLEEAGWIPGDDGVRVYAGEDPRVPPGTRFSVQNYVRTNTAQELVQAIVESLASCGIEVIPSYWNRNEMFADGPEGPVFGRQFDLTVFRWLAGATPPCDLWISEQIPGEDKDIFPYGWDGSNNPGFSNPEFDQACLSALQSLPGQPGYEENHLRAQEIFAEQLPVIILKFGLSPLIARPDFCGELGDNIEENNYGPDC